MMRGYASRKSCGKHNFRFIKAPSRVIWFRCTRCNGWMGVRRQGLFSALVKKPRTAYSVIKRNMVET